jgi:hypothetical protein
MLSSRSKPRFNWFEIPDSFFSSRNLIRVAQFAIKMSRAETKMESRWWSDTKERPKKP